MKKIETYFIGSLLKKTTDPFEQARIVLLLRFTFFFSLVFVLPIINDLAFNLTKALVIHVVASILLITFPFIIKYTKSFRNTLLYFFSISAIINMLITLCLNPTTLPSVSLSWLFLFISLGALLLRGIDRLLFVGFFLWLPIIYIFLNKYLNGDLTLEEMVEKNQTETPLFIIVLPIILMIYALYSNSNTIFKAQIVIQKQKSDIELQKQEITDSIVYSKRIQNAILTAQEEIKSRFPNSFILYKPKDVVSGDFYFFKPNDSFCYFAVADCTGHGVPGAFMSLIGFKELSIAQSQSESPKEILFNLNNQIKKTLQQNQADSTRDGMDIAIAKIEDNRIEYSGANRPLLLIRAGSNTIEEFKATKSAIGGFTEFNQTFEEHKINLNKGDCLYMFTDGYADQFGGTKQKKITTKRFKELLLTLSTKPIDEQKNGLTDFFEEWKGESEQIDDVLILGIKI